MVGHLQSTLKINFYAFGKKGQPKATRSNTSELYQDLLRVLACTDYALQFCEYSNFPKKKGSRQLSSFCEADCYQIVACRKIRFFLQIKKIFSKRLDFAKFFFSDWNSFCQSISKHNAQRLTKLCSWINFFFVNVTFLLFKSKFVTFI